MMTKWKDVVLVDKVDKSPVAIDAAVLTVSYFFPVTATLGRSKKLGLGAVGADVGSEDNTDPCGHQSSQEQHLSRRLQF